MYSNFAFLQILCTQFWKPFLGPRSYFQDVKLNDPCWVLSNLRNSEISLSVLCVLYSLFICSVLWSFLNTNRPDNFCLPYLLFLFNWVENGTLILASYDGHDLLPAPGYSWQGSLIRCLLDSSHSFSICSKFRGQSIFRGNFSPICNCLCVSLWLKCPWMNESMSLFCAIYYLAR